MRARSELLQAPIEKLERALAKETPGRERAWAEEVDRTLGRVQQTWERHIEDAEAPDGMFAEVDLTRPSLVREVGELCHEHQDMFRQLQALREEVRQAARAFNTSPDTGGPTGAFPEPAATDSIPDFGVLRQQLEQFLAALIGHRDHEAALVIESVTTDIGAGD
jgi:hypothetical protein